MTSCCRVFQGNWKLSLIPTTLCQSCFCDKDLTFHMVLLSLRDFYACHSKSKYFQTTHYFVIPRKANRKSWIIFKSLLFLKKKLHLHPSSHWNCILSVNNAIKISHFLSKDEVETRNWWTINSREWFFLSPFRKLSEWKLICIVK